MARGRVPVSLSLPRESVDLLAELAEARNETRSAVVVAALEMMAGKQ